MDRVAWTGMAWTGMAGALLPAGPVGLAGSRRFQTRRAVSRGGGPSGAGGTVVRRGDPGANRVCSGSESYLFRVLRTL